MKCKDRNVCNIDFYLSSIFNAVLSLAKHCFHSVVVKDLSISSPTENKESHCSCLEMFTLAVPFTVMDSVDYLQIFIRIDVLFSDWLLGEIYYSIS